MSWYRTALLLIVAASGCSTLAVKPAEETAQARREVDESRATYTRPWTHDPSAEDSDRNSRSR